VIAHVSMYALPYQPMSEMDPNSLVIAGIAVEMMMRSRATRKRDAYMHIRMAQNLSVFGLKFFSASAKSLLDVPDVSFIDESEVVDISSVVCVWD
jgi:hypothetical protein